jgi:hypothetical protein
MNNAIALPGADRPQHCMEFGADLPGNDIAEIEADDHLQCQVRPMVTAAIVFKIVPNRHS